MRKFIFIIYSSLCVVACKKKIEIKEIEVEKKYSWKEIKGFEGNERIFLSSGSSANAIYLQQPFFYTEVRNQDIISGVTLYGVLLPTDIQIRIPITHNYCAAPFSDTILRVLNNKEPLISPSGGYFNLKQIDPTITAIQKNYGNLFKCMAINKNGTLLLAYNNNRAANPFTFLALKIKTNTTHPYVDTIFTKVITIPRTSVSAYPRYITAINDYFLIDLSGNGIYKVKEDGTFAKVYNETTVDAFYEWQGKIYAHAEWNKVLVSTDNGDNWQEYNGTNSTMTLSNYYVIKDSLIGAYRDNLFTLKWNGLNYSQRFLKNDGVEGTRINGVEVLRDTVYLATTSGLFVKPLTTFFDTK